jgi:FAD/FMN-containing dehydrogenase
VNRRNFNQSLLAAGWVATSFSGSALAAATKKATRITGDIEAVTRTGGDTTITKAALKELQKSLRGALLLPGNTEYDTRRKVWNGMIDKRPGLIARCSGASDVVEAVNFARDHDLLVAVRGGGHSISGKSVCDGGIMIDLSPMRWCTVDPDSKTALLGPGSVLGDLDHESQRFGLATPAGTVSHTGAAGLTLGGGHGRLSRSYGLTCDNVKSVDIVTADGRFLQASARENKDIFWGVRGGGGNFGVVTKFEYELHQVGPMVYGGPMIYPIENAAAILKFLAGFMEDLPRAMAIDTILLAPPGGKGMCILSVCYLGDFAEGERLLKPLRAFMKPKLDNVKPTLYNTLQTAADNSTPPGKLYYNKAGLLTELRDDFLEGLVDRMLESPSQPDPGVASNVIIQHLGGAVSDVKPDATAYAHRKVKFDSVILSGWTDPAFTEQNTKWLKDSYKETMEPHTVGFYSNHMVDSDQPRLRETFQGNYEQLVKLKNKYDPDNLFHLNPNVKPTA